MNPINGNSPAATPLAPPLQNANTASSSQTENGQGQPSQPIASSGALAQRSTLTPLAPAPDASAGGNIPHLPHSPRNFTLPGDLTLNGSMEILNDWSSLNLLHNDIGAKVFRVEKSSDGTVHAIGEKNGDSFDRILTPDEVRGLDEIGNGNDRFVFSGHRGGAGHVMVSPASDIGMNREAIVRKVVTNNTMEMGTDAMPLPESSGSGTPLKSDPKLWISLGTIAAGLVGLAVTGIVQATALTPEPEDPQNVDPDAAAATAEKAANDALTKEAFQDPDKQKVEIDDSGNAKPSGILKDDVKAEIEQKAKEAGEAAKAKAIEDNAEAQKNYTEQKEKHDREMLLSSGIGYGISSALTVGGVAGLGATVALHRRDNDGLQPAPNENSSNSIPMNPYGSTNAGNSAESPYEVGVYQDFSAGRNSPEPQGPEPIYAKVNKPAAADAMNELTWPPGEFDPVSRTPSFYRPDQNVSSDFVAPLPPTSEDVQYAQLAHANSGPAPSPAETTLYARLQNQNADQSGGGTTIQERAAALQKLLTGNNGFA